MRTWQKQLTATVCAVAFSVFLCLGLSACSSESGTKSCIDSNDTSDPLTDIYNVSGGTASTVNGVAIGEDVVTNYINLFRDVQGLNDDEAWAEWLSSYGYESVADLRDVVVDWYDYLELIIQAADEQGVTVSDEVVDEQLQQVRDQYDTDEDWEEALASAGTNEALERLSIKLDLLQDETEKKLADSGELGDDLEPTDEVILESIEPYDLSEGAKRSSHILFSADDEETAKEVLDKIKSGDLTFEDAAKEYSLDSSASDGGDVGWDNEAMFVDEYQDALDKLDKGDVSDLVTSDYGIHIITCTDVQDPVEGEVTSLDQLSDGYVKYWRDYLKTSNESEAYETWMDDFEEKADIVINDMPDDVPYYVDVPTDDESGESSSGDETASDASTADSAGTSSDSSAADTSGTSDATSSSSDADSSSASDTASDSADSSSAAEEASDSGASNASAGESGNSN